MKTLVRQTTISDQSLPRRSALQQCAAFTLAEVAVTLVIVGIGMVLVLQGLNTSTMTAAHTSNMKLARDLALITFGEVKAGLYQEDLEDTLFSGTYSELGYENFYFEIALGEENFPDLPDDDERAGGAFDSWRPDPYSDEYDEEEEERDEDAEPEPYEKVKIRITYPPQDGYENTLILEEWIPWKQVYGEEDEEISSDSETDENSGDSQAGEGENRQ